MKTDKRLGLGGLMYDTVISVLCGYKNFYVDLKTEEIQTILASKVIEENHRFIYSLSIDPSVKFEEIETIQREGDSLDERIFYRTDFLQRELLKSGIKSVKEEDNGNLRLKVLKHFKQKE